MTNQERIDTARKMRDAYIAAELAVLSNQSYMIGGQSLTRANLEQIRKGRQEWEQELELALGQGQRRIRQVIPEDDRGCYRFRRF